MAEDTSPSPPAGDPPTPPPSPAPSPPPAPADPPPSPLTRLRQAHARLGTANRIALYGTIIGVLAYVTPLGQSLYDTVFPEQAMVLSVEQQNSICLSNWITASGSTSLAPALQSADLRQIGRWEREGRITHADEVQAAVTARGNVDKAVVIRDITITVVKRGTPAQGRFVQGYGCGADGNPPEFLVVDLDGLPLKQAVPVSYLQRSPHQADARKAADKLGAPITLPRQMTADGSYNFFLTGRTLRYDCQWIATVTWWDGKETHQTRVDNDGRPFRVSAADH